MREQGMMGRRERTPNANPLYPIHFSMCGYIRFSPLNDPQDAVPVSRDWSTIALSRICVSCFEYPKNPYLNQATQKKYLPKCSYPKSKISNPQKILPASLLLEIQSTLFVLFRNFFFNMAHNMRLNSARFASLDSFTEIEVFLAPWTSIFCILRARWARLFFFTSHFPQFSALRVALQVKTSKTGGKKIINLMYA